MVSGHVRLRAWGEFIRLHALMNHPDCLSIRAEWTKLHGSSMTPAESAAKVGESTWRGLRGKWCGKFTKQNAKTKIKAQSHSRMDKY